jgi:hypothetical protein
MYAIVFFPYRLNRCMSFLLVLQVGKLSCIGYWISHPRILRSTFKSSQDKWFNILLHFIFCLNWLLFNFHDCCYSTVPILRTPNHIIIFSTHQFKLLVNKDHLYFFKIYCIHNHLHLPWCPIPYVSIGGLMRCLAAWCKSSFQV